MIRAFQSGIPLPFEWRLQRFEVIDSRGKTVAPVLDLLYDPEARTVRYVMVEIGGLMGIAGKKVLLPRNLLTRAGSGQLLCEVSLEKIMDSPPVHNPEEPTRKEEGLIFDYFEREPYWDERKEGNPGGNGSATAASGTITKE